MYMRFMSDLHLEFGPMGIVPELDTDADTVLVLAGDVAVARTPSQYTDFILNAVKRFKHVIWIPGNHEHYRGSVLRSIPKIQRAVGDHDNLSVINDEIVDIDNVRFICSTMWTDFANDNPMAQLAAQMEMNDYKYIRVGPEDDPYQRTLLARETVAMHRRSLDFIIGALSDSVDKKVVVVTHHAPSHQSVCPGFEGHYMNPAYCTPLDRMIEMLEPDYWIHGHLHCTNDYYIGKTNILSNPRGYFGHELNRDFDPLWKIDLS